LQLYGNDGIIKAQKKNFRDLMHQECIAQYDVNGFYEITAGGLQ
jgi:hypothetical protein